MGTKHEMVRKVAKYPATSGEKQVSNHGMLEHGMVRFGTDNTVWYGMVQGVEKEGKPGKEESPKSLSKRQTGQRRVGCKTLRIIHKGGVGGTNNIQF